MARIWKNVGVGYGWQISGGAYNAAQVNQDLQDIWNAGIRNLRIYLPAYNVAAGTLTNIKSLVTQALAMGFWVKWGLTSDGTAGAMTSTQWGNFKTYMTGTFLPYVVSIGLSEVVLGNEEEGKADGSTLSTATVRADIKTMAASFKAGSFLGVVSYDSEVNHSNITNWTTDGIGTSLDKLYFNQYDRLGTFQTNVDQARRAFGSKTGVSEFDSLNLSTPQDGFNAFNNDELSFYFDTYQRMQILKDNGMSKGFFFTYRDGTAVGFTNVYALALSTGGYRMARQAIVGDVSPIKQPIQTTRNYSASLTSTQFAGVTHNSNTDFTATGQHTWMGRAKFNNKSGATISGTLIYKALDATNGIQILVDANVMTLQERKTNTKWAQTQTNPVGRYNRWFNWAVTYDGTAQDIHFYIDGIEQLSAIGSFSWANVVTNTAQDLKFGKDAATENINGQICDCGKWDRVLTIAEIRDFNRGIIPTTSAVFMALNDGTGTTVADTSGNGNTCTISAATMWSRESPQTAQPLVTPTTTAALNFAAATLTPRLTITNPAAMKSLTAVTFECWVNIPNIPMAQSSRLLFYNGVNVGYLSLINTTGTFRFDCGNGTSIPATTSTQKINAGAWNHVAGVWDGSVVKLYVNGRLDSATNALVGGNTGDPAVNPFFGNSNAFTVAVQGLMQEIRISSVARYTADFIPQTTPFTSDASTVGLWHLDDGSGTSPVDSGPNGLTLTMGGTTNPIWALGGLRKTGTVARLVAGTRNLA